MDGKKVLMFTMSNIPNLVEKIMKRNKLNKEQIINLLPHREPMLLIDELINIQDSDDAGKIIKGVISECIKKY